MSSNLPPGCGKLPGEGVDETCEVCKMDATDCTCPECPICGSGDPKCKHMDHPVKRAVMPLLILAQDRAQYEARKIIDQVTTGLIDAGGDARKYAPFPSSTRDGRAEYARKAARYRLVRALTKPVGQLYAMCPERCAGYIKQCVDEARAQYLEYVEKLIGKTGPAADAKLEGDHVWSFSILTVTKEDGTIERWRTQQIVNVSKLGKLFNQWPTRKDRK